DSLFHRFIYLKNYSEEACPDNKSSIMAEITYQEGDDISKMTEDEITRHVIDRLSEKDIIDGENVCFKKTFSTKYAYVIYDLDYRKNISKIKNFLTIMG
ncbi:MAG: FAD-dependent oxidoreductase, partial [Candidatus Aenigmatarchaeota archaeon]